MKLNSIKCIGHGNIILWFILEFGLRLCNRKLPVKYYQNLIIKKIKVFHFKLLKSQSTTGYFWGCRGHDHIVNNYLCNQCLSPLTLWVRTTLRRGELDTTLYDKVCQWLATGHGFLCVLRFPPPIKLNATI